MEATDTDPPEDIPDEVVAVLEDSTDGQLRGIIHYAQRILEDRPSLTDRIEPRQGENLLHTEDHGAYKIAVVERPGKTGEARGPFAYRVKWEPDIDGEGGQYGWHYLGRVHGEQEDG